MNQPHVIAAIAELDDHTFAWMLYARPDTQALSNTIEPTDVLIAHSPAFTTLPAAVHAYTMAMACIHTRIFPSPPPPPSALPWSLQDLVAALACPN